MARITAKSRPNKPGRVSINGRLDDACLLAVDVIRQLGSQIRATFAAQGITDLEPEGQEPNDIALAMVHMNRAVVQHEQELEQNGGKPLNGSSGPGTDTDTGPGTGADAESGDEQDTTTGATQLPEESVPPRGNTH